MNTTPYWPEDVEMPKFAGVRRDFHVDVARQIPEYGLRRTVATTNARWRNETRTPMKTKSPHGSIVRLFLGASTAVLVTASALAADLKSGDKSFVEDTYQNGLAEVKLAELALGKTAQPDVKAFAQHMVTDHGKANTELKALADSKKVSVATEPSMVAKGKAKMMDAKSGADFDKAFAKAMVDDHEKAVKQFEKTSTEATDADVKAFATKTLPTLKTHLSMAQELQGKVGK